MQEMLFDMNNGQSAVKRPDKSVFGTKEWAAHSVNICTGCSHDCRYCYAKGKALELGHVAPGEWKNERVREKDVFKKRKRLDGTIMFPTTHDITPTNLEACLLVIQSLLRAGNSLLIVSKPHLECIEKICKRMARWKDQVLFRFTIGATDPRILSYWEPGAPPFSERLSCLGGACQAGFKTSVSAEPLLDPRVDSVADLVEQTRSYVTDSIWLGTMNHANRYNFGREEEDRKRLRWLMDLSGRANVLKIYDHFKDDSLIKWKESIKKVAGIEVPTVAGQDI